MATYVVSDVHGQYDLLIEGLNRIDFSDDDYLWCLGDAIDRGPDGIKLLQYVMEHDNMDLILGNHEFMMLNSVDESGKPLCNGHDSLLWSTFNGGDITFANYNMLSESERISLLSWMKSRYVLKTIVIEEHPYCLTHSYYKETCENKTYSELSYKDVWNITWSSIWRDDYETHAMDIYPQYDYTFIVGHVPVQRIRRWIDNEVDWNTLKSYHYENVINIDGGCSMGPTPDVNNGIIILRLEDMTEYPIAM